MMMRHPSTERCTARSTLPKRAVAEGICGKAGAAQQATEQAPGAHENLPACHNRSSLTRAQDKRACPPAQSSGNAAISAFPAHPTWDGGQQAQLILRLHGIRNAIWVDHISFEALRLQPHVVRAAWEAPARRGIRVLSSRLSMERRVHRTYTIHDLVILCARNGEAAAHLNFVSREGQ